MPLMVDVLDTTPLQIVRLIVTGVPANRAWRVMGSARGETWVAGEGVSTGTEVVFSDPWAALGSEVSYVLRYTSSAAPADIDDIGFGMLDFGEGPFGGSLVVVREYAGRGNIITDLTGRKVVEFEWHPRPGNPQEYDMKVSFLDVPGVSLPAPVLADTAGRGSGAIDLRTVPPYSQVMHELVMANRPVLIHHSHSRGRCPVVDCDILPVQSVVLTKVSQDRRLRADVSERVWSLTYQHVPRPHRFLAPVVTWEDVRAHFVDFAELAGTGMTNAQLARGDWVVAP